MLKKKKILFFLGAVFLLSPFLVSAQYIGERQNFFVDSSYDLQERERVEAVLERVGEKAYFYIDSEWMEGLDGKRQEEIRHMFQILDNEFTYKIYPRLTSFLGPEWIPGIDEDVKVTILFHPMEEGAGGYFNKADEYPKAQSPRSNEREMIYVNTDYITTPLAKSFLAHEMVHLITFNQKEREHGVGEEVWLNEGRAEYVPTYLGYDDSFEGSNLQRRVETFLQYPTDSLTEWRGKAADYGALSMFMQYLAEKYGEEIVSGSLQSEKIGIESINEALKEQGFEEDFSQVFTDWTITVFANSCSLGKEYCFEHSELSKIRVTPSINFLPLEGKSTLGVTQSAKNWAGNWIKFVGSKGTLKLELIGNPGNVFEAPYLVKNAAGEYSLGFLELDQYQRGSVLVQDFGTENISVVIIPSIQSLSSSINNPVSFFWEASTIKPEKKEPPTTISLEKPLTEMSEQEILTKIQEVEDFLKALQDQLAALTKEGEGEIRVPFPLSCQRFDKDLYFGMRNSNDIKCLQEFLKSQGDEIYPEGLVTGNFLNLTQQAVIRFQEKYSGEILEPLGLGNGTGYVGTKTRGKINQMLAG